MKKKSLLWKGNLTIKNPRSHAKLSPSILYGSEEFKKVFKGIQFHKDKRWKECIEILWEEIT